MEKVTQIITPNVNLNKDLFDENNNINVDFSKFLDDKIEIFKKLEQYINIIGYQITGSLMNYNYTDESDIDFHIIVSDDTDVDKLDNIKNNINDLKINFKGYPFEIYFQKENEPHTSSSLYDAKNKEWIIEPIPFYSEINTKFIYVLLLTLKKKYIDNIDNIKATELKNILKIMRKRGLMHGEYDEMNLLFKIFRSTGLYKLLKDISEG